MLTLCPQTTTCAHDRLLLWTATLGQTGPCTPGAQSVTEPRDVTSGVSARHRPSLGVRQADPSWLGLHLLCALGPLAWGTL